ncbi:MAG: cysteine desulfurase [Clostridia bacterium]|nr:cysteine desulfurase [Clostridia bacterium]
MIYLDNAASTQLDEEVLTAMMPYLKENFGNAQSQHSAGRACANAVSAARDKIASLAGCAADEVYFISGGTEAGNTALKGVCATHRKGHLVLSSIEHASLSESALDMKKLGFDITFVEPEKDGAVRAENVLKAMREDTIFCAVMAANNETGVIQPVEEIGKICREKGVFFYADCVQSAAYMPLPVNYADGIGFSSHKFYGPKGAGALILKKGSKVFRLISGGMQERGFRGGTVNTAGIVGTAVAYERACASRNEVNAYVKDLRDGFVARVLKEIDGTHLNGAPEKTLPSIANISFEGCDGENILFLLDLKGICVSTGAACAAGAASPSETLTSMGCGLKHAKSSVRFSFGKHNTKAEADETLNCLKFAVDKIRNNR